MNTQSLNSHPSTLNLILTRTRIRGEYCEGYLTIDGLHICDTLENANAIVPAGTYPIRLVKCKQHSRKMPILLNLKHGTWNLKPCCSRCHKLRFVSNNTTLPCYCPMIKPGNGVHNHLDGCILVGKYNCQNSLIHPKAAFDSLYERIRKSMSRGHEVKLSIA